VGGGGQGGGDPQSRAPRPGGGGPDPAPAATRQAPDHDPPVRAGHRRRRGRPCCDPRPGQAGHAGDAGGEHPLPRRAHGPALHSLPVQRGRQGAAGQAHRRGGPASPGHRPHRCAGDRKFRHRRRFSDPAPAPAAGRGQAPDPGGYRHGGVPRGDHFGIQLRAYPPQGHLHALPRLLAADAGHRLAVLYPVRQVPGGGGREGDRPVPGAERDRDPLRRDRAGHRL